MRKKILATTIAISLILLSQKPVFAESEEIPEENEVTLIEETTTELEEIYINEIYSDPKTGDSEFVEFYFSNPADVIFEEYFFEDNSSTFQLTSPTEILTDEPQYYIYKLSSKLNNPGDIVSLQKEEENGDISTIQTICYGNVQDILAKFIAEGNEKTCDLQLAKPVTGMSLSYIEELNEFKETTPTPGEENIFVNINFLLKDETGVERLNYKRGEQIYISSEAEVYGLEDYETEWFLDDVEISSLEILTEDLSIGDHIVKVILGEELKNLMFTIQENLEGLEISEIFPNPKGNDETGVNEWIEIFNSSNREINIKGLKINRKTFTYEFDESYILSPNEYFVIYPGISLTNSDFEITLTDSQDTELDKFVFTEIVGEDESVILFDEEIKLTTTTTKGLKNIYTPKETDESVEDSPDTDTDTDTETVPAPDFSTIEISEIFPNPEGTDEKGVNEWVELYNSGSKKINLKGLILKQITSKNYQYIVPEDLFINSKSYVLLHPDFSINNTEATFQILNEDEEIFDEVFYVGGVKEEQSVIRQDGSNEFLATTISTPGEINVQAGSVLSAEDVEVIPIADAKNLKEDSFVSVKGAITVKPDVLGNEIFYIQDETGGIQIDLNGQGENFLEKDVIIEVEGYFDIYHSEPRIKVAESTITPINQAEVIQPKFVRIGEIDVGRIGSLIKIEGTVIKTSGNTFYINDQSGTIKVQIKDTTGIERPECRKGYYAEITGILSAWDTDENGNPSYRLLPRFQEDVFISETLANTGGNNFMFLFFALSLCIISSKKLFTNKD